MLLQKIKAMSEIQHLKTYAKYTAINAFPKLFEVLKNLSKIFQHLEPCFQLWKKEQK